MQAKNLTKNKLRRSTQAFMMNSASIVEKELPKIKGIKVPWDNLQAWRFLENSQDQVVDIIWRATHAWVPWMLKDIS